MSFSQAQAEDLAIQALAWMADDPEVIGQFMGWSGADVDALIGAAEAPEMMLAVIDFILLRDEWVLGASAHLGIKPERFAAIRAAFPGGQETHWT